MTKRIINTSIIIAMIAMISTLAIIMGSVYYYFTDMQKEQLGIQLDYVQKAVENEGISYLEGLENTEYRLTLVNSNGDVMFDSKTEATSLENHSDREEIKEAIKNGEGHSTRVSKTMTEKTIYLAKKLADGTVLRISISQVTILALLLGMLQPLFLAVAVAVIVSIVLANNLVKRIMKPEGDLSEKE